MRKEFMVERQGRQFVLYAGLLNMAHENGLKSITTNLVQVPNEANNRVAIATATVVMEKDGIERVFTGIGDAAPNNVAPAMQTCLIRMAETRSKARALRDAVNVGVAAFEELGEEDAVDSAPERGYASSGVRSGRPAPIRVPQAGSYSGGNGNGAARNSAFSASAPRETTAGGPNATNGNGTTRSATPKPEVATPIPAEMQHPGVNPILDAQADAIRNLAKRKGLDPDVLAKEKFEAEDVAHLTQSQASDLIKALNERTATNGRTPAAA